MKCEKNGIVIEILKITKNKEYICNDCWATNDCRIKKHCQEKPLKTKLIATELEISVLNATSEDVQIRPGLWEIVDTEGFAYGGLSICEKFNSARHVNPDTWNITPGTRVRFFLLFPELKENVDLSAMTVQTNNGLIKIIINKLTPNIAEMFENMKADAEKIAIERDYELRSISSELQKLKKNVFARFNNVLGVKERTALDIAIINSEFEIREFLRKTPEWKKELIEKEFEECISDYKYKIDKIKVKEKLENNIAKKIDMLNELTPREFEEWSQSLFVALGYENVTLTPLSNDKGIDLLMERNGARIAVQCKKI